MKTYSIFRLLAAAVFVCCFTAISAQAQDQDQTKPRYQGTVEGMLGDCHVLAHPHYDHDWGFNTNHGVMLNKTWFVGGGLGYFDTYKAAAGYQLYATGRYYLQYRRYFTPFATVNVGAQIEKYADGAGPLVLAGVGVRVNRVTFQAAYQNVTTFYKGNWHESMGSWQLRVGYVFGAL